MAEALGDVAVGNPSTAAARKHGGGAAVFGGRLRNRVPLTFLVVLIILFVTGALFTRRIDKSFVTERSRRNQSAIPRQNEFPSANETDPKCPEYFRWIHEDLKPWKLTGITEKMMEKAKKYAQLRIIIIDGRIYMEKYSYIYETRDVFTVWGFVQLLKLYPGKLPDLELMFLCEDRPGISKKGFWRLISGAPPPLFHYCGDDSTFDIPFPDWSFWGWPEVNIMPWEILSKDLKRGNERMNWTERVPYAYWKGNTDTKSRRDLAKCNVTDKHDWNARIYHLDWGRERGERFQNTDLASQCTHRYKIYVEGNAWSVSKKYILACDSMSLLINSRYYDFFTRGLEPMVHYWPINDKNKCKSIKFAVDWGNKHIEEVRRIGKRGSQFIEEELKMEYVYDYMFHLLSEYAKLFKYRPVVTRNAIEVCSSLGKGMVSEYKTLSMVKDPSSTSPCTMPPPYEPSGLQALLQRKSNIMKQIEMWEAKQKF